MPEEVAAALVLTLQVWFFLILAAGLFVFIGFMAVVRQVVPIWLVCTALASGTGVTLVL